MNNKFTGEPAGYGFINFESDQKAIFVMHRLGGKVIPGSNPPVRFKLNHNSTRLQPGEIDTSVWVGDLTPEVDDFALYQFFTQRYQTVRCAKVVLDENGYSKGYGFVRFGAEAEQQHALANMTGEMGLGQKPIKVSMANQKNRAAAGGAPGLSGVGGVPVGNGAGRGSAGSGLGMGWGAMGGAAHSGAAGNGASDGGPWPSAAGAAGAAAAAAAAAGGWGSGGQAASGTAGSSLAHAATAQAQPQDYAYYQQYAAQYAQQQAQQQQQQYAAATAWAATAWQHQQQQQQ